MFAITKRRGLLLFPSLTFLIGAALIAGGRTLRTRTPPALALDGYCPVTLACNKQWKAGQSALTSTYRGQLFHFADRQCQQVFESDPQAFAPAMEGADVVLLMEEDRRAPGQRRYGYRYHERVFLFAGADSLKRFTKAPGTYLAFAQQAER